LIFIATAWADEILVWHSQDGQELAALTEAARAFEQQSHHTVRLNFQPFESFESKVETSIPYGNGPDLMISGHDHIGRWAGLGLLEKVASSDWFPPGSPSPLPAAVEALTWQESTWGWPLAYKSVVLFYDPKVIPVPPKTTDALIALARAHTGNGSFGLAYQNSEPYFHAAWLHGFGGAAYVDGKAALDTPEQIAALTFAKRLAIDDALLPLNPTGERVGQLYRDGRTPMVLSGPWFLNGLDRPIAAAVLPIVSETGLPARPYLTVDTAFIATHAQHPEAARQFAMYLAGPEGAAIRQSHGQAVVYAGLPPSTGTGIGAVLARQAETAVPMPNNADLSAVFEAEAQGLRQTLRGVVSPKDAAHNAQDQYARLSAPPPEPAQRWPYVVGGLAILAAILARLALGRRDPLVLDRLRRHAWDYLWVAPAVLAVSLLVVTPFVVGATVSLYVNTGPEWTFVGMRHFADILLSRGQPITSPMSFFYTLAVTVLWTAANLVLHVSIGMALAMVLREPWIRLRSVWRALLILPWAIPNYITALIWKTMFDAQYGAVNAILGALHGGGPARIDWFGSFSLSFCANLVTNTWLGFPFMMVVTLGALQSIPRDLEEAAELDGANFFQRFRHVIWPLLRPSLLPAVVMGSVWTFNMFNVVFLVSRGEPDGATEILISQAYRWAFSRGHQYGYAAAYAVIIFGVLLLYTRAANRLLGRKVV
jgi:arabinogalactan oligomer/maltooligosaccharide transport system permease protein